MLVRLLLAVAVVFAIVWFVQNIKGKPPALRRRYTFTLVLSLVASALILLALTGRVHWLGALIGAALPFLRQLLPVALKLLPFIHWQRKAQAAARSASTGNSSEVHTDTLHMVMDHDSGQLRGEVKSGPFAGMALDALEMADLKQLLAYCQQRDSDATQLLLNYLRHRFGDDWEQPASGTDNDSEMSRQQALDILGLKEGASREDIVDAHRRLMQKLHPDRGGSDFLASQINRAKDVLLGD